MPYHYYKPRGPDECVTYLQNESSRRGNHHRFITEKQVFARWAKQYNITFTHPKWWKDFYENHKEIYLHSQKPEWALRAGFYYNSPWMSLQITTWWMTAIFRNRLEDLKKKKKAFGKNLLSDQMTEMSENVFCRKRISVLRGFWNTPAVW